MRGPVSVVVACYNQSEQLELALAGFARQGLGDFEIVVADDGSAEDLEPLLARWAPRFAHGIQLASQEDHGFRKTRILNRAIHVARFDALVFSDADCVPHRDFLRNHLRYLESGSVVSGRRAHVERDAFPPPEVILAVGLGLSLPRLLLLWLRGRARVIEHGFVLPFLSEASGVGILGSNFSAHRDDVRAVNGFNEEYQAWGIGEDTDLDLRLRLHGTRVRVFRNTVVQYHVAHDGPRTDSSTNLALLERTRAQRNVRSPVGLAEIREGDFQHERFR